MESETIKHIVQFSEVDSLRIVWHGNYIKYIEEARDKFCQRKGWGFDCLEKNNCVTPIYDLEMHYLHPAVLGDELTVTATLEPKKGAKLIFDYEIKRADGTLILTGQTTQLFTDLKGNLIATRPEFFDKNIEVQNNKA